MTPEEQEVMLAELQELRRRKEWSSLAKRQFQRLAHIYCEAAKIAWEVLMKTLNGGEVK